jgi:small subunit ribosomal protein S7
MSRKGTTKIREVTPDPLFSSILVSRFVSYIMQDGKKAVAEKIIYSALEGLKTKGHADPIKALEDAVNNVKPHVEVRPRRIGGATYQIPMEVSARRSSSLALRWIIASAKARAGVSMADKLLNEALDALNNRGGAVSMRENKRKMAEANKAFAHYRW